MRIRIRVLLLLTAASAALSAQPAWAQTAPMGGQSFVDRFAVLDRTRWYISNGWSNGPHQNCTWSNQNVKVDNSVQLYLTDQPGTDRPFTCAELQSTEFFGYGTYEVRMRGAASPGTVSAFFTYTGAPHAKGRPHNEIDFAHLGKNKKGIFLNYFAGGPGNAKTVDFEFDATADAHDYAFEWQPGSIRWFIDGRLVREARESDGTAIPNRPQKIYLSIWNGTGWDQEEWLGRFAYAGRPLVARYEYVAFTQMGAPCQFATSIVCRRSGSKDQRR